MYLSKFGEDFYILKTTVTQNTAFELLDTIPEFYKHIIYVFNSSKIIQYEDFCVNFITQPIWGNKFIKFKNKTLFFKTWIKAGVKAIGNLKFINGKLDEKYLMNIIKDHRNFYQEINILQQAFKKANIII